MEITNEQLFLDERFEELYEKNEGFLHHMIKKFNTLPIDYDEMFSLANLAFTKTLCAYDPNQGRFITYLSKAIANELLYYTRKNKKHIEKNTSLEKTYNFNGEKEISLSDMIADTCNTEEDYLENEELTMLAEAINKLDDLPKVIVQGLLKGKSQQEVADSLNISQSYLSRVHKRTLKDLKRLLENPTLKNKGAVYKRTKAKIIDIADNTPKKEEKKPIVSSKAAKKKKKCDPILEQKTLINKEKEMVQKVIKPQEIVKPQEVTTTKVIIEGPERPFFADPRFMLLHLELQHKDFIYDLAKDAVCVSCGKHVFLLSKEDLTSLNQDLIALAEIINKVG